MNESKGHFEKGAWVVEQISRDMIGKKIVHVGRVECPYGYDGSYCTVHGDGSPANLEYKYIILHDILPDGSLVVEWQPRCFPGELSKLEPWWNDGDWIEVS